ncbi:branched-chain amino acid transport system II carrier protein [Staphylococcus aureus]
MKKKLTFKENMFIGSMLFGLFFGAGNLIFPIHFGRACGSNVFIANLGFLITAIGLPFTLYHCYWHFKDIWFI